MSFLFLAALAKLQQERIEQREKEEEQRRKEEEEKQLKEATGRQNRDFEDLEAADEMSRMLAEGERANQNDIPTLAGEAEIETEEVPLNLESEQVEFDGSVS